MRLLPLFSKPRNDENSKIPRDCFASLAMTKILEFLAFFRPKLFVYPPQTGGNTKRVSPSFKGVFRSVIISSFKLRAQSFSQPVSLSSLLKVSLSSLRLVQLYSHSPRADKGPKKHTFIIFLPPQCCNLHNLQRLHLLP